MTLYKDMDINTILGIEFMAMMGRHYLQGSWIFITKWQRIVDDMSDDKENNRHDSYACVNLTDDRHLIQVWKICV